MPRYCLFLSKYSPHLKIEERIKEKEHHTNRRKWWGRALTQTRAKRSQQHSEAQAFLLQNPVSGKDKRDVRCHVNHGSPVDGEFLNIVVFTDNIGDYSIFYPLKSIGHGVHNKQKQHKKPGSIELGVCLHFGYHGAGGLKTGKRLRHRGLWRSQRLPLWWVSMTYRARLPF